MRGLNFGASLALFIVLTIAGCGKTDLSQPPKLNYGSDTCAECRMIIQDERFASAVVTAGGEIIKFDDIGCMQIYQQQHAMPGSRAWVHDLESAEWLDAGSAVIERTPDRVTPMGYGIAAHKRRNSQ